MTRQELRGIGDSTMIRLVLPKYNERSNIRGVIERAAKAMAESRED
jgi:hypothetical protein